MAKQANPNRSSVDQREEGGATPLLLAVYFNRLKDVKNLVEIGAGINKKDSYNTPLTLAVSKKHLEITEYLVRCGASLDLVNVENKSPLVLALEEKDLNLVQALISCGVPENLGDANWDSILLAAIKYGVPSEILKCFVQKEKGNKTLISLAQKGDLRSIKILVENGANADFVGADGDTLLAVAVRYMHLDVVRYLLTLEVNICKVGVNGKPPLLWAVLNEDLKMVEYLLDHGAAYVANTVFLDAINTKNLQLVKLLYNYGADTKQITGTTPLFKAVDIGSIEIAKFLLKNGANFVEDLNVNETIYLLQHIEKTNFDMVKLLTENGAKLEMCGTCGHTPLTKAVETENYEMVKYFIEHHVDVNQPNESNTTPLVIAAKLNNFRIFQYLVQVGATITDDSDISDKNTLHYYKVAKNIFEKKRELIGSGSNQEDGDESAQKRLKR